MSHNLEIRDGRYSFAFTGDRNAIWHRLGQELNANATRDDWIKASGFDYTVVKVPALASLEGSIFDHIEPSMRLKPSDKRFLVRTDTAHILGFASDGYQLVQPSDCWDWFERYITVDDRFHIDAAGVLHSGERLWITARFNGDMTVAGEKHVPRLLMSTSFDQSQPTINQATTTRAVCNNTLNVAHADKRAVIKTRHNTRFNGEQVARELAQIAQSFATYKAMGDAMADTVMAGDKVADFFKAVLDIPAEAKKDDVSGRKLNQYTDMANAYNTTKRERNTTRDDVWTALQAVTRYVDHDRSVRNADNETVGRFDSGTWGSGDALKGKAMGLLLPLINDKVPVYA